MSDAPTLVLLHGWGLHAGVWQALRAGLSPPGAVLAPDLPGYGVSPQPESYTPESLAQALMQQFTGPVILCGWSMGGMVAMAWAAARPEQVRGLLLVSTTPAFTSRPGWSYGLEASVLAEFATSLSGDHRATLQRFMALQAQGGEAAREVRAALHGALRERDLPAETTLAAGLDLLAEADMRAQIGNIRCPTWVIHGARDKLCPVAAGNWLAGSIAGARMLLQPHAAHVPFLSHPEWFLEQVNSFVRDLD